MLREGKGLKPPSIDISSPQKQDPTVEGPIIYQLLSDKSPRVTHPDLFQYYCPHRITILPLLARLM